MTVEKAAYHHGDLRAKLIDAAIDCVETDGVSKLSLRKIAGQLGVSHNAPYMHFASKDALLDAVVAAGFGKLRTNIADAGGQHTLTRSDWSGRVKAGFAAYIAFARERPGLYALMHIPRSKADSEAGTSDANQAGRATLASLAATLEAGQRLGKVRPGDTSEMALWVWATLHGLSSLTLDQRSAFGGRTPLAVSEAVLDHLIRALAD
ncbi:MAG: TetR/AcrR family transcriptional regulator [Roseitalea sp.]|jgi:AcrR family transcriptional regulator|nr:TetR/AcrR family transcriptional regulator [Roseitalea sp.]MBO6722300.1 TetR/AcrR family transcriptional regulator [Roseitalea sp.]MBO6742370.1 TetR/AcrR family transcriptional regulator [Roseitalea sp.]